MKKKKKKYVLRIFLHMRVKNIHGTSSDRYAIPHLKQQFSSHSSYPKKCQVYGCSNQATATAHVRQCDRRKDGSWGLTPVCAEHNHYTQDQPMYLKKNAAYVPVSQVRK